jgi:hypothetical protein
LYGTGIASGWKSSARGQNEQITKLCALERLVDRRRHVQLAGDRAKSSTLKMYG